VIGLVAVGTRADPGPTPTWAAIVVLAIFALFGLWILRWPRAFERVQRACYVWLLGEDRTNGWYGESGSRRERVMTWLFGGFFASVGVLGIVGLATGVAHT
jgi:hypothetical protein